MTRKQIKEASMKWEGNKDIEDLCLFFTTFMTTPTINSPFTPENIEKAEKQRL